VKGPETPSPGEPFQRGVREADGIRGSAWIVDLSAAADRPSYTPPPAAVELDPLDLSGKLGHQASVRQRLTSA